MDVHAPATPVVKAVHDAVDTGKDAFAKGPKPKNVHLLAWRKHAKVLVGAASLAGALGIVAYMAFRRTMNAGKRHQAWKKADVALDKAVEDSLDASDPIAKY